MQIIGLGLGAAFAALAMMIAGAQLMDFTPEIAIAAGANEGSALWGVLRLPIYVILLTAVIPLVFAAIGLVGLMRRF